MSSRGRAAVAAAQMRLPAPAAFATARESRREVVAQWCRQLRVLCTEIVEETAQYRTLNSLTTQIVHDYAGRILAELVRRHHKQFGLPVLEPPRRDNGAPPDLERTPTHPGATAMLGAP